MVYSSEQARLGIEKQLIFFYSVFQRATLRSTEFSFNFISLITVYQYLLCYVINDWLNSYSTKWNVSFKRKKKIIKSIQLPITTYPVLKYWMKQATWCLKCTLIDQEHRLHVHSKSINFKKKSIWTKSARKKLLV